jgi:uncharacterized protein (DUF486 family)
MTEELDNMPLAAPWGYLAPVLLLLVSNGFMTFA